MDPAISFATPADLESLQEHGVSLVEATRQWASLTEPAARIVLDRPCTVDDGIVRLAPQTHRDFADEHQAAASAGRWQMMVPASGAASRMFALKTDEELQRFGESIERFAFFDALQSTRAYGSAQTPEEMLHAVVSRAGLGYGSLPKGLVTFHQYADQTRTPFEEHLAGSVLGFQDDQRNVRVHLTVSADHQPQFEATLKTFAATQGDVEWDVTFSVQHPSTDTIAMDASRQLLRTSNGQPVLRPGGHGALIENLNDLKGDLVFLKNIDNVCHGRLREPGLAWMRILGGYTASLQSKVHHHLQSLASGEDAAIKAAMEFVTATFPGSNLPASAAANELRTALIARLRRPLRVCGMVKNEGEPGGGPFWVKDKADNTTPQIVETAEVDMENSQQQAIVSQSTHFNPVFLALAVRDEQGNPYDLNQFVEADRAIITTKTVDGESATVLERPGLWNGGMAHWNTIFVEVPSDVFTPVKTVLDLLRDEHQPA